VQVKSSNLVVSFLVGAVAIAAIVAAPRRASPKVPVGVPNSGGSLVVAGGRGDGGGKDDPGKAAPAPPMLRYVFRDGSGSQEMQLSFVGKKRIKVAVNRHRADGCAWTKTWFGRFDQVTELTDDDGETFLVDEYKAEKGQFSCDMLVDIEQGTREHASVSAFEECGKTCRLDGAAQMKLVR
jgi:hypothetical protein